MDGASPSLLCPKDQARKACFFTSADEYIEWAFESVCISVSVISYMALSCMHCRCAQQMVKGHGSPSNFGVAFCPRLFRSAKCFCDTHTTVGPLVAKYNDGDTDYYSGCDGLH